MMTEQPTQNEESIMNKLSKDVITDIVEVLTDDTVSCDENEQIHDITSTINQRPRVTWDKYNKIDFKTRKRIIEAYVSGHTIKNTHTYKQLPQSTVASIVKNFTKTGMSRGGGESGK
ncbi:hypothetical protein RF11_09822 [Thelohanellus kitauei]|uniref:Uncharacterized protein n=1 Tax=Thelohanellus kitauei TaxID=669202 RepID=A0A0C2J634_THEKT|nr:hypothetical protein RF11_09822 [Thelohanellus kitauei]